MDYLLSMNGVIFSVIATGIVDLRVLPLAGLRRIISRLDRARRGNADVRRTGLRFCAECLRDKLVARY